MRRFERGLAAYWLGVVSAVREPCQRGIFGLIYIFQGVAWYIFGLDPFDCPVHSRETSRSRRGWRCCLARNKERRNHWRFLAGGETSRCLQIDRKTSEVPSKSADRFLACWAIEDGPTRLARAYKCQRGKLGHHVKLRFSRLGRGSKVPSVSIEESQ